MFDYDVIVVGCGPAGLMAVTELKENGINVLGVDKKPRLDKNVRSASGFSSMVRRGMGNTFNLNT